MRNICALGFIGVFLLFGGCATHSATNDEQVDLYLNTLDDKHFVWCKLDLEQCRKDFEEWRLTARGRMIMKEFEKEMFPGIKMGQMIVPVDSCACYVPAGRYPTLTAAVCQSFRPRWLALQES